MIKKYIEFQDEKINYIVTFEMDKNNFNIIIEPYTWSNELQMGVKIFGDRFLNPQKYQANKVNHLCFNINENNKDEKKDKIIEEAKNKVKIFQNYFDKKIKSIENIENFITLNSTFTKFHPQITKVFGKNNLQKLSKYLKINYTKHKKGNKEIMMDVLRLNINRLKNYKNIIIDDYELEDYSFTCNKTIIYLSVDRTIELNKDGYEYVGYGDKLHIYQIQKISFEFYLEYRFYHKLLVFIKLLEKKYNIVFDYGELNSKDNLIMQKNYKVDLLEKEKCKDKVLKFFEYLENKYNQGLANDLYSFYYDVIFYGGAYQYHWEYQVKHEIFFCKVLLRSLIILKDTLRDKDPNNNLKKYKNINLKKIISEIIEDDYFRKYVSENELENYWFNNHPNPFGNGFSIP